MKENLFIRTLRTRLVTRRLLRMGNLIAAESVFSLKTACYQRRIKTNSYILDPVFLILKVAPTIQDINVLH